MTNEQIHRFHDLVREAANAERTKAEEQANTGNDEYLEGIARGTASGYISALSIFWKIVNETAQ